MHWFKMITVIALVAIAAPAASAATVRVPSDAATIQAGIMAASAGDTVLIAPGVYEETDILFAGRNPVVRGEGPSEFVIVRGDSLNHIFRFENGETSAAALENLTIENGLDGVFVYGASPALRSLVIRGCTEDGMEIHGNAQIDSVVLEGNARGMYVGSNADPLIRYSIIRDNGREDWDGGGVHVTSDGTTPRFERCEIYRNTANRGGAYFGDHDSHGQLYNCTVYGNTSVSSGQAAYGTYGAHIDFRNSIVWGNVGGGGVIDREYGTVWVTYTDIQGGWWGPGNLNQDPMLHDPDAGEFALLYLSPCIDAGWPDAAYNEPDGTRANMGSAYDNDIEPTVVWGYARHGDASAVEAAVDRNGDPLHLGMNGRFTIPSSPGDVHVLTLDVADLDVDRELNPGAVRLVHPEGAVAWRADVIIPVAAEHIVSEDLRLNGQSVVGGEVVRVGDVIDYACRLDDSNFADEQPWMIRASESAPHGVTFTLTRSEADSSLWTGQVAVTADATDIGASLLGITNNESVRLRLWSGGEQALVTYEAPYEAVDAIALLGAGGAPVAASCSDDSLEIVVHLADKVTRRVVSMVDDQNQAHFDVECLQGPDGTYRATINTREGEFASARPRRLTFALPEADPHARSIVWYEGSETSPVGFEWRDTRGNPVGFAAPGDSLLAYAAAPGWAIVCSHADTVGFPVYADSVGSEVEGLDPGYMPNLVLVGAATDAAAGMIAAGSLGEVLAVSLDRTSELASCAVSPGTLSAFSLVAPSSFSTDVSVYPLFEWSAAGGDGVHYELHLSENPTFPAAQTTVYGPIHGLAVRPPVDLVVDTTYFWKVKAVAPGVDERWGDAGSFAYWMLTTVPQTANLHPMLDTDIPMDRTLIPENSPYWVEGNPNSFAGTTLTIRAGTELRVADDVEILVGGYLHVLGDPNALVRFVPRGTSWQGVNVQSQEAATVSAMAVERVGEFEGSTYYASDTQSSWMAAEEAAMAMGGHLVAIGSAEENAYVNNLRAAQGWSTCWLGFSDRLAEGAWVWSSGESAAYTAWNSGEPNNSGGGEDYAHMLTTGLWNDTIDQSLPYFIEVRGSAVRRGDLVVDLNHDYVSGNIVSHAFFDRPVTALTVVGSVYAENVLAVGVQSGVRSQDDSVYRACTVLGSGGEAFASTVHGIRGGKYFDTIEVRNISGNGITCAPTAELRNVEISACGGDGINGGTHLAGVTVGDCRGDGVECSGEALLVDVTSRSNLGVGVRGGRNFSRCHADSNTAGGVITANAQFADGTASDNLARGFYAPAWPDSSRFANSAFHRNAGDGVRGGISFVSVVAQGNSGVGILASPASGFTDVYAADNLGGGLQGGLMHERCTVERNGGAWGIIGVEMAAYVDGVVADNAGGGIQYGLTFHRCTVEGNGGDGIAAHANAVYEDVRVRTNSGRGVTGLRTMDNSFVEGNSFEGVVTSGDAFLRNVSIAMNGGRALWADGRIVVHGLSVNSNGGDAIYAGGSAYVEGSMFAENVGMAVRAGGGVSSIRNSTFTSHTAANLVLFELANCREFIGNTIRDHEDVGRLVRIAASDSLLVAGNTVSGVTYRDYLWDISAGPTFVENNNFMDNGYVPVLPTSLDEGSALRLNLTAAADTSAIVGNLIARTSGGGHGAGVRVVNSSGSPVTISDNTLSSNWPQLANADGGALHVGGPSVVRHNTLTYNAAARGSAVYLAAPDQAAIAENIITNNTGDFAVWGTPATLTNNNLYFNYSAAGDTTHLRHVAPDPRSFVYNFWGTRSDQGNIDPGIYDDNESEGVVGEVVYQPILTGPSALTPGQMAVVDTVYASIDAQGEHPTDVAYLANEGIFIVLEGEDGNAFSQDMGELTVVNRRTFFPLQPLVLETAMDSGRFVARIRVSETVYDPVTNTMRASVGDTLSITSVLDPTKVAYVVVDEFGLSVPELLEGAEDEPLVLDAAPWLSGFELDEDHRLAVTGGTEISGAVDSVTVTFTPPADWSGEEEFTVELEQISSGSVLASAMTTVRFLPVNDAPMIAVGDTLRFDEDAIGEFDLSAYIGDADGDGLVLSVQDGDHVTATADGLVVTLGAAQENWFGHDAIVVTVDDQAKRIAVSDTVRVEVLAVNDAPLTSIPDEPFAVLQGDTVRLDLAAYVVDVDGDDLSVEFVADDAYAVSLEGLAFALAVVDPERTGLVAAPVTISDGSVVVADTVYVAVTPILDVPEFIDGVEDVPVVVDAASWIINVAPDSDYVLEVASGEHVFASVDGTLVTLVGGENWFGDEPLEIGLARPGAVAPAARRWTTVRLAPANDAPAIAVGDTLRFDEDTVGEFDLAAYVADPDGDGLTMTVASGEYVMATVNGFVVTLETGLPHWNGQDAIIVTVDDANKRIAVSDTVRVEVLAVNDRPVIELPADGFEVVQGDTLVVDLGLYVSDVDGDPLILTVAESQAYSVAVAGLVVTLVPANPSFTGALEAEFEITDGTVPVVGAITVNVLPLSDVPLSPGQVVVADDVDDLVKIGWQDRSINELGFIVASALDGQALAAADTVGQDVEEDYLGGHVINTIYSYNVAAYNEFGASYGASAVRHAFAAQPVGLVLEDVPDDNGGWLAVGFEACVVDTVGNPGFYRIQRWDGVQWIVAASITAEGALSYEGLVATPADSSASGNAVYNYRVVAELESGSYTGAEVEAYSVDNTPPDAVEIGIANPTTQGVYLEWVASAAPDLHHYNVYRRPEAGEPIIIGQPTGISFLDRGNGAVSGADYWYHVTAVDRNGNETPAGAEQLVRFPVPAMITDYKVTVDPQFVLLSWRAAAGSRPAVTVARRSVSSNVRVEIGTPDFDESTSEYAIMDQQVEPGASYVYIVTIEEFGTELDVLETDPVEIPRPTTALLGNRPNPFNPSTTVSFDLNRSQVVRLHIYDVSGRLVHRLVDGVVLGAGRHDMVWMGRDDEGRAVPSGTYVYVLDVGGYRSARKMMLLK